MSRVSTESRQAHRGRSSVRWLTRSRGRLAALLILVVALVLVSAVAIWTSSRGAPQPTRAPEADKVLAVQAKVPFQVMIPAYLPKDFDRPKMTIKVNSTGPGGEPMVELVYPAEGGATVTLQEWVPVNPGLEILASSIPVQTKWGRAWLLNQGDQLVALWADVGPTRVSVFTPNTNILSAERLLSVADTLGPASNKQVFSFDAAPSKIKRVKAAPPYVVPTDHGVQKLTLVVTPGGYSPLRFSVKHGIPVKLTFRQLGQVGCGNELIFPATPGSPSSLQLKSPSDQKVLSFTPQAVGTFAFYCSHQMYRGLMTVTP